MIMIDVKICLLRHRSAMATRNHGCRFHGNRSATNMYVLQKTAKGKTGLVLWRLKLHSQYVSIFGRLLNQRRLGMFPWYHGNTIRARAPPPPPPTYTHLKETRLFPTQPTHFTGQEKLLKDRIPVFFFLYEYLIPGYNLWTKDELWIVLSGLFIVTTPITGHYNVCPHAS